MESRFLTNYTETTVESLNYFLSLAQHPNFECHLDDEWFHIV